MRSLLAALLIALAPAAAAEADLDEFRSVLRDDLKKGREAFERKHGTWLVASLASYHFERKDYCEVNPGVGFEHELTSDVRLVAGSFQNSYCKASGYVGLAYLRPLAWRVRWGAALIALSGYEDGRDAKRAGRVILAPLPALAWEGRHLGVNLLMLPPHQEFKGALGLQLKARF